MRYVLDSNAVIAAMASHPLMTLHLATVAPGDAAISSIVHFELLFGAYNSDRVVANLQSLDRLSFPILPFDAEDARAAGEIRAALRRRGTPIGPYDVLIAGQALARGLTLVTANTDEFVRVEGLLVEDWTA